MHTDTDTDTGGRGEGSGGEEPTRSCAVPGGAASQGAASNVAVAMKVGDVLFVVEADLQLAVFSRGSPNLDMKFR